MKTRNGFVSNSSSSSFVCEICGAVESGYDASCPEDLGFSSCEKGHTFCSDHLLSMPKQNDNDNDNERDEDGFDKNGFDEEGRSEDHEYISERCPICQLKYITEQDRTSYICKKINMTLKEIDKEIREKFKTLKDFSDFLKGE